MDQLFLSIEEDRPLGIFYSINHSVGVIELESFFSGVAH